MAAPRLARLGMTVALTVGLPLAVTTCDNVRDTAVLHNASDEQGLTWVLMSTPDRVNDDLPFIEGVGFPGTTDGGCVDNSWGWRIVDEDGTVLVERSFEDDPVCGGQDLYYEGNGVVTRQER